MEAFHVTKNLKFATTMATCGAPLLDANRVRTDAGEELVITLGEQGNGIACKDAVSLWQNKAKHPLETLADEIIEARGITQEEYAILQLEICRAALGNRGVILKCGMNKKPMVQKTLKSGRQVIFREGTPKEAMRGLIN